MNEQFYKARNAELGAEFDLYAREHPDWMAQSVPEGAIVVLQTEDVSFNAWARLTAEQNRHLDDPPRPLVLVHVREMRPPLSRIVRAEVELVTS